MDVNSTQTIRATIAGQEGVTRPAIGFDPESEAKKLLELMAISGVLPAATVRSLLGSEDLDIIDADIVSEEESDDEVVLDEEDFDE